MLTSKIEAVPEDRVTELFIKLAQAFYSGDIIGDITAPKIMEVCGCNPYEYYALHKRMRTVWDNKKARTESSYYVRPSKRSFVPRKMIALDR